MDCDLKHADLLAKKIDRVLVGENFSEAFMSLVIMLAHAVHRNYPDDQDQREKMLEAMVTTVRNLLGHYTTVDEKRAHHEIQGR